MRTSLLLFIFLAIKTHATGLNFWESSSLNSALASANGAHAEDASVLALVPASISQLSQQEISASLTYYEVNTDYSIFLNETNYKTSNPIPMGFYSKPINQDITLGLSIYSRTAADISVPSIPLVHPKETRVTPITVSVSPTLAYQWNDVSVAATLEYIYSPYAMEQTSCLLTICSTSTLEDDTAGWSSALSAQWRVTTTLELAITHRFATNFGDENIYLDLPAISSLYSSFALAKNTLWHNSYSFSQWNNKGITFEDYNDPIGLLKGYRDSHRFASSLAHRIDKWSLRAGISFDQAVDQFGGVDIRYRLGLGYAVNQSVKVDLAFINESYAVKDVTIEDTTLVKVQNQGKALSLGATYRF